jgi:hypothetical protein
MFYMTSLISTNLAYLQLGQRELELQHGLDADPTFDAVLEG